MKTINVWKASIFALLFTALVPVALKAQDDDKKNELQQDAEKAKAEFIKSDDLMKNLFDNSIAYVIFPNVGKGAIGVGGAAGNGVLYEGGKVVGTSKLKQVSVGFQFGGQSYREVIFFENNEILEKFKRGDLQFSAEASAVAVTKGASGTVKFKNGVMVFTQEKGGLMYEAAIAGQHFSYKALSARP